MNSNIHLAMAKMANKFDSQTLIMNEYMCSSVCPCANPTHTNIHGETTSPSAVWAQDKEALLNIYGRTKFNNDPSLRKLYFENSP